MEKKKASRSGIKTDQRMAKELVDAREMLEEILGFLSAQTTYESVVYRLEASRARIVGVINSLKAVEEKCSESS